MKIAIVGFDTEGRASYDYFAAQGHELEIRDQNEQVQVPEGVTSILGPDYLKNLDEFDLIVRTAGLPPHKILDANPSVANKITTHINEFLKVCPTKHVIGVTGTKGKGTTSSLIAEMLKAAGKEVYLAGNIGLPPLTFINKLSVGSRVVLELSSFQLIDVKHAPHVAVCLMVVPEHLDWHADLEEYITAKQQLFSHQTADDRAIYFADNELSQRIVSASPGQKIPYFSAPGAYVEDGAIVIDGQTICQISELKLLGEHNWQNACAAVTAVWKIINDPQPIQDVLTSFSGLPHRLEMIRELGGVKYYDDSFGTTPETAMVAVKSFDAPEIVILGGHGKGIPFTELAKLVYDQGNIKQVITIGASGREIADELRKAGFNQITEGAKTMDAIVTQAHELAEPGDIVLLSTACASFDMFRNYKERGEEFSRAVQSLA